MSSYFNEGEKKSSAEINNESVADKSFCKKINLYFNYIRDKLKYSSYINNYNFYFLYK